MKLEDRAFDAVSRWGARCESLGAFALLCFRRRRGAPVGRAVPYGDFVRAFAVVRSEELARERLRRERSRVARRAGRAVSLGLCAVALGALWLRVTPPATHVARTPVTVSEAVFGFDAPAAPAVSVESIDFGARDGAIFLVSAPAATDTTVVWLGDDLPVAGVGTL